MDLNVEDTPAWKRQEATLRELEMILAILVMRDGHDGHLSISTDELHQLRAMIPKVLPNVVITYGERFRIDVF